MEGDKQDIRQEPFSLPGGFEWDTLDLGDENQVHKRYEDKELFSYMTIKEFKAVKNGKRVLEKRH